ncbi:MAG: 16S rRNA (cytosine(1402)-N(4))-methyltransferase RsmH [Pseudomonadota bacterium]
MHIPVLLDEVLKYMNPQKGETYADCTFGAGGYSKAILSLGANVVAIDQDPSAAQYCDSLSEEYPGQIKFVNDNFANIAKILNSSRADGKVNGIVLDLGVSSMQLDQADRGFSFMRNGPLDMRMGSHGISAEDVVNTTAEEELANIIFEYGDERDSRKISRAICRAREIERITTTSRLAEIVRRAVGFRPGKIDPSTKTFQALRIWVNDELGALERVLSDAEHVLVEGGRLVVVTFHSLEDRIVKQYLQDKSEKRVAKSKYAKVLPSSAVYRLPITKVIKPTEDEVKRNPRARSAKLRVAIKN